MKILFKIQIILLVSAAALWGCDGDSTPGDMVPVVPRVSFPVTEPEMAVVVDDAVHFEAVVESPGQISCCWYIDDILTASTPTMTYVFKKVGTYNVRFEASNEAGKAEKNYTVTAAGVPLVVEFSNEEETLGCMPGDEVQLTATVLSGDKGVEHEWKVGDEVVSTTAAFKHVFDKMGAYTIAYKGVNSDAVSVARTWMVAVDELPLEIEFSVTDAVIPCEQGKELQLTATVKNGAAGLVHEWKVGDEVVSTTAEFKQTFPVAGTFTVAYKGVNGKQEIVTRTWTVEVAELPLEVGFSTTEAKITCKQDQEVLITATVKNGGATGVTHEWTVGGEMISATAEFRYAFAQIGTYTIAYKGMNGRQETVTHEWTVEVTDKNAGYMFENFEARDAVPGHFVGNANALSIAANPYSTAVNPSAKVLKNSLAASSHSTSGYVDMGFGHVNNRVKYRAVRVKVYIGPCEYYPRLQIAVSGKTLNKRPSGINGKAFDSNAGTEAQWKALIKTDDWNILVYDLVDCGFGVATFENISTVQFRPLSKFDGKNIDAGDASVTNTRTVYYDDIEFFE